MSNPNLETGHPNLSLPEIAVEDEEPSQINPSHSQSVPNLENNSSPLFSIGIYLDEEIISVSTVLHGSQRKLLIHDEPAKLYFGVGEIQIGNNIPKDEAGCSFNSFNLYSLIKEPSTGRDIFTGLALSSEDILTEYFKQLGHQVMGIANNNNIDNTVLTVPFLLSSLEKKRIKTSMQNAGFQKLRICPSFVTTGVTYKRDSRIKIPLAVNERSRVSVILVIHASHTTFSMAIIKVGHKYITPADIVGPIVPLRDTQIFISCQQKLFTNKKLSEMELKFIKPIYEEAFNRLRPKVKPENGILVQKYKNQSELKALITSLCTRINYTTKSVVGGPLAGAALFASQPNLTLYGLSRMSLSIGSAREDIKKHLNINLPFVPGWGFVQPVLPSNEQEYVVREVIPGGKLFSNVGTYKIVPQNDKDFIIEIDEDGIITVSTNPILQNGDAQNTNERPEDLFQANPDRAPEVNSAQDETLHVQNSREQDGGLDENLLEIVNFNLEDAVQAGIQKLKSSMLEITDRKQPLCDSQITCFFNQLKEEILDSFTKTFEFFTTAPFSSVSKLEKEARNKLEHGINSLLIVFLKRHEVMIGKVTAATTRLMLEAENMYETDMEEFVTAASSVEDITKRHTELTEKSLNLLNRIAMEDGVVCNEQMEKELRFRLNQKL